MTLRQLEYVLAISEKGSMNKAAEALFVSQPSLSGAVKELEQELGITLFRRTGRGAEPTREGADFLLRAKELYKRYTGLMEQYSRGKITRRFSVSTQHYSFAVKAFADTVRQYDTLDFDFSLRETTTLDVIRSVGNMSSDIGIIYMSELNKRFLTGLFAEYALDFVKLIDCSAYVYIADTHPLAHESGITFERLMDYPCLMFEQEENGAFFLSEEILADRNYPRVIKTTDRATMLNLMRALNGYTLCSGIICEEINGSGYTAVPFIEDEANPNTVMSLGYIVKSGSTTDGISAVYIGELKKYLGV